MVLLIKKGPVCGLNAFSCWQVQCYINLLTNLLLTLIIYIIILVIIVELQFFQPHDKSQNNRLQDV